ncbi:MAG: thioredoxin family protein [Cytophagales bacterium]
MINLSKYLQKSMSYTEYRDFIESLVFEEKTNWHEQSEEMINFTKLNFQRSKRIHKQFRIKDSLLEEVKNLDTGITWLAITEPWCGDAAQNLPAFHEISQYNDFLNLKLVLRDENPELIDNFLTNGTRSIPKIIQLDENLNIIDTWGPRPEALQKMVLDFKLKPWTEKQKFYEEVQSWYNKDKSMTLQNEILALLQKT